MSVKQTPIEYALSKVVDEIDPEILKIGFPTSNQFDIRTIEQRIRERIIDGVLSTELMQDSGVQISVRMSDCIQKLHTDSSIVIEVPQKLIGKREILKPLDIMFTRVDALTTDSMRYSNPPGIAGEIAKMTDGTIVDQLGDSDLAKLDSNTIWAKNISSISSYAYLNLLVTQDADYSSLSHGMRSLFANLVVLYVKKFLYNRRFSQKRYAVLLGLDAGMYEEAVSEYSGAGEEYEEIRKSKWSKAALFSDPTRRRALVTTRSPRG